MDWKNPLIFTILFALTLTFQRVISQGAKNSGERRFSKELYKEMYELAHCCGIFQKFTLEDMENWVDQIMAWEGSKELEEKFPYYHAGYDKEKRPVWVFEFGKYNFQAQVQKGKAGTDPLEKYLYQGAINVFVVSMKTNGTGGKNLTRGVGILDMEGFDLFQFADRETLEFISIQLQTYTFLLDTVLERVILINANFNKQFLDTFGGDILGPLTQKIELYGTDKKKWEPVLQEFIPQESIPSWYGGSKDFKPVNVYG